jgi:site-specific recombinase XerD
MGRRQKFVNSAIHIVEHNRDGSFRTKNDRGKYLVAMTNSLYSAGFQLEHVKFIKTKHIHALVALWKKEDISPGTMKNRLSHIRWLLGKLGHAHLVPSNDELGIEKRRYVTNEDKSRELSIEDLDHIHDPRMRLILRGQELFGLRVEESLKIQPHLADQKNHLFIQGSWAKGGRDRTIPIQTPEQRAWLDEAKALIKNKQSSLIPEDISYKTYRKRAEKTWQRAGINHCHGHRHLYAQRRFEELTGYPCPAKGGPTKSDMTRKQFKRDKEVRLMISQELGHSRPAITNVYLGSASANIEQKVGQ